MAAPHTDPRITAARPAVIPFLIVTSPFSVSCHRFLLLFFYWLYGVAAITDQPRISVSAPATSQGGPGKAGQNRSAPARSEEHASELQSLMRNSYAVFCLKKKTTNQTSKPSQT